MQKNNSNTSININNNNNNININSNSNINNNNTSSNNNNNNNNNNNTSNNTSSNNKNSSKDKDKDNSQTFVLIFFTNGLVRSWVGCVAKRTGTLPKPDLALVWEWQNCRKKNWLENFSNRDVSENSGVFHDFHHPFWDTIIFGNIQIENQDEPTTISLLPPPQENSNVTFRKLTCRHGKSTILIGKNTWIFHGDLFDRAFPCEVFLMCHLSPLECKKNIPNKLGVSDRWLSNSLSSRTMCINFGPGKKCTSNYMDVSENKGTPKWMVYNGKPYFLMDDLGVPLFLETSICWHSMRLVSWKLCNWWIRFGFIKDTPEDAWGGGNFEQRSFVSLSEKNIWYIYIIIYIFTTKSSGDCHWTNCYSYLFKLLQLFYMYISQTSRGKMWLGFLFEAFANRYQ